MWFLEQLLLKDIRLFCIPTESVLPISAIFQVNFVHYQLHYIVSQIAQRVLSYAVVARYTVHELVYMQLTGLSETIYH